MTWLQKYQSLSLRLYEAGLISRFVYKQLKGEKGFLTAGEFTQYMKLFDYYLNLCNEVDQMTNDFCKGITPPSRYVQSIIT